MDERVWLKADGRQFSVTPDAPVRLADGSYGPIGSAKPGDTVLIWGEQEAVILERFTWVVSMNVTACTEEEAISEVHSAARYRLAEYPLRARKVTDT